MSLINQMLKDLEKRSKSGVESSKALSGLLTNSGQVKLKRNINVFVLFIVLIAFCLFVGALIDQYNKYQLSHPAKAFVAKKVTAPALKPVTALANSFVEPPAVMTGISLQSQGNLTTMRFLLDKQAFYHLTHGADHEVTLELENTRLVANLPPMDQLTQFIKNISMTNLTNGNLQMTLSLSDATELSHVALATDGKLPELQIELTNQTIVPNPVLATDAPKNNQSIKTVHNELDIDMQYKNALKYINQKHYNEAITLLAEILDHDPEFMPARESLAKLLIEQGDNDNAQAVIAEGLRLKPHDPLYTMLQARILMASNHLNDALQILLESPPSIQVDPDYYAFIAALYQRVGKSNLAVTLYEQLLTTQPTNATWWTGLGIALENVGKSNQAIEAYQKASSNNLSADLRSYVESRLSALA